MPPSERLISRQPSPIKPMAPRGLLARAARNGPARPAPTTGTRTTERPGRIHSITVPARHSKKDPMMRNVLYLPVALSLMLASAPALAADADAPAKPAPTGLLPVPDYSGDFWN